MMRTEGAPSDTRQGYDGALPWSGEGPVGRPLSRQELKVLDLVAQGLTNPEIGGRLGLSRDTVKEYLSNAMRKLASRGRLDAVLEAQRRGIL